VVIIDLGRLFSSEEISLIPAAQKNFATA
jgi:hypothetical protein